MTRVFDGQFGSTQYVRGEAQPRGHAPAMLVVHVPVNLADEHAAILVADPFRNRHVIDAGHHAAADEVMPQIVELKVRQLGPLSGFLQRGLKILQGYIALAADGAGEKPDGVRRVTPQHRAQMRDQVAVEINGARVTALRARVHADLLALPIDVIYAQARGLGFAQTAELQQTDVIDELAAVLAMLQRRVTEPLDLALAPERALCGRLGQRLILARGQSPDDVVAHRELEHLVERQHVDVATASAQPGFATRENEVADGAR